MFRKILAYLRGLFTQAPVSVPSAQEQVDSVYDRYDLFLPEQQYIYHYFDGKDVVKADPMVLHRKLMDVAPDLTVDMKLARSASKDASLGHVKMVEKVRRIFGVKGMEEGGLTEISCVQLLNHFLGYCELLKKSTSPLPTSPTATPPPSAPSSEGASPTPSTPDSGSTGSEPSTAAPPPSPLGSE